MREIALGLAAAEPSAAMRETCERLLLDVAGLCTAARRTDYVAAALAAADLQAGPAPRSATRRRCRRRRRRW